MFGALSISQTCHVRTSADPQFDPSFCTPNNQRTADIFRGFKRIVNNAAKQMAVPYSINATNPNLDEDTFRLMILVSQATASHLVDTGRATVPALVEMVARARAGSSPDEFSVLADNTEELMILFQDIADGTYGRRVAMTPTLTRRRQLDFGALLLVSGAGVLGAITFLLLTPVATRGAHHGY